MASEELILDLDEDLGSLTRPELQGRCGRFGIKRNLKTEEMRTALDKIRNGQELDSTYYTKEAQKWAPISLTIKTFAKKHYKKGGLTCGTTILILIVIIIIVNALGGGPSSVPPSLTNGTFSPGNSTSLPQGAESLN